MIDPYVNSLKGDFAAEITGVDLNTSLTNHQFEIIHDAVDTHCVAVFHNQFIKDDALIAFAERFGPLETPLARDQYGGIDKRITMLSNVGNDGEVMAVEDKHLIFMKGNLLWHSDSSYKPAPSTFSILAAQEVPTLGGETEFADARACYDDWHGPFGETEKDDLEDLVCEHSIIYSRSLISGDIFSDEEKAAFEVEKAAVLNLHHQLLLKFAPCQHFLHFSQIFH